MTSFYKFMCDCCEKEEETTKNMIAIPLAPGEYLHIHTNCLGRNISVYLSNLADSKTKKEFLRVLFGRGVSDDNSCGAKDSTKENEEEGAAHLAVVQVPD